MLDLSHIIQRFKSRGGASAQCSAELEAELSNTYADGWLVEYTRGDGQAVRKLYEHAPYADLWANHPDATTTPFVAVALPKGGDDEA